MTPFDLWFQFWAGFWSAALAQTRSLPNGVTDIREGHVIRARRHWQRVGRL